MGCKCKEKNQRDTSYAHIDPKILSFNAKTSPIEGCLYCAEKHLSTAAALARELGYIAVNRGYVIGEIVAACWHLNGTKIPEAISLADKLRDFRHKIQNRADDKECQDFAPYLEEIDKLINTEKTKLESKSED